MPVNKLYNSIDIPISEHMLSILKATEQLDTNQQTTSQAISLEGQVAHLMPIQAQKMLQSIVL